MSNSSPVRWLGTLAIAAVGTALVLVLLLVAHERGLIVDDAFISFRFAQNLAHGWGLRWNPDCAPGEGFTNLAFVLVVAAAQRVGLDPVVTALATNAMAITIAVGVLLALARLRGPWIGVTLALLLTVLLDRNLVVHSSRGLETATFACLNLLFVAVAARSVESPRVSLFRALGLGLLGLLLVLCRPDGIVTLAAVFAAWWAWTRLVRMPTGAVRASSLVAAFALTAYFVWKEWYFGYALPNAFYVKAARTGFSGIPETRAFLHEYAWLVAGLGAALVIAAAVAIRRRNAAAFPPELLIAALLAVAWVAYSARILHEVGFNHRFIYPLVFPLVGCLVASIGRIPATPRLARVGIASSVVALVASAWQVHGVVSDFVRELRSPPAESVSIAGFRRAGEAIRAAGLGWRPLLECPPAGALPYYAQCRHFDEGLVDDLLNPRTPAIVRKHYRETLHPDVILEHFLPASPDVNRLEDDPVYRSSYVQEWWLGDPGDRDASMRVTWGTLGLEARKSKLFARMVHLRDHATLIGEIRMGGRRWRSFLYVANDSPFRAKLVDALSGSVDIPAENVRAEDWPPH